MKSERRGRQTATAGPAPLQTVICVTQRKAAANERAVCVPSGGRETACRRTGRAEEEEHALLLFVAKLLAALEGTSTGLVVLDRKKKGNNPIRRIINIL